MTAVLTMSASRAAAEGPATPPRPVLELSGYVQADVIPWDEASSDQVDDNGASMNTERAMIRRARLRATATRGAAFAQLELDGNTVSGPVARLVGASVGARIDDQDHDAEGTIRAGLFKIPFGREVPSPESARDVLEPTTAARALFPGNYDAGVLATARWRVVEVNVAAINGAPSGDAQFRGQDPSGSWDLVGRAGARGELRHATTLAGGISALVGSGLHRGKPATEDRVTWIDQNDDGLVQVAELVAVPGVPATPSESFDRSAIGADIELGWCLRVPGKGRISAEIVLARNLDRGLEYADPTVADRDLRELGWHVQLVQALTRHAQVAARWESYRPDRDATEMPADPEYRVLTIAAEAHTPSARLIFQFDHSENPRGRALDGTPITLGSSRVTLRAQLTY